MKEHRRSSQSTRKLSSEIYRCICTLSNTGNSGKPAHQIRDKIHPTLSTHKDTDTDEEVKQETANNDNACSDAFFSTEFCANPLVEIILPPTKPKPKPIAIPPSPSSPNDVAVTTKSRLLRWKTYSIRNSPTELLRRSFGNFAKSRRTVPIDDPIRLTARIIDVYNETIQINANPIMYARFEELRKAFDKYRNIDKVRNPNIIRKNRYNIIDVAYNLQIMVMFLEGLNEMRQLCSQQSNVMLMMKARMLMFVNYNTHTHLYTTIEKWIEISSCIRDELLYVLDDIFAEIGEE